MGVRLGAPADRLLAAPACQAGWRGRVERIQHGGWVQDSACCVSCWPLTSVEPAVGLESIIAFNHPSRLDGRERPAGHSGAGKQARPSAACTLPPQRAWS
jgi:hypothetical protein